MYVDFYDVLCEKLIVKMCLLKMGDLKDLLMFVGLMILEFELCWLLGWMDVVVVVGVKIVVGGKVDGVMFEVMLLENVGCE